MKITKVGKSYKIHGFSKKLWEEIGKKGDFFKKAAFYDDDEDEYSSSLDRFNEDDYLNDEEDEEEDDLNDISYKLEKEPEERRDDAPPSLVDDENGDSNLNTQEDEIVEEIIDKPPIEDILEEDTGEADESAFNKIKKLVKRDIENNRKKKIKKTLDVRKKMKEREESQPPETKDDTKTLEDVKEEEQVGRIPSAPDLNASDEEWENYEKALDEIPFATSGNISDFVRNIRRKRSGQALPPLPNINTASEEEWTSWQESFDNMERQLQENNARNPGNKPLEAIDSENLVNSVRKLKNQNPNQVLPDFPDINRSSDEEWANWEESVDRLPKEEQFSQSDLWELENLVRNQPKGNLEDQAESGKLSDLINKLKRKTKGTNLPQFPNKGTSAREYQKWRDNLRGILREKGVLDKTKPYGDTSRDFLEITTPEEREQIRNRQPSEEQIESNKWVEEENKKNPIRMNLVPDDFTNKNRADQKTMEEVFDEKKRTVRQPEIGETNPEYISNTKSGELVTLYKELGKPDKDGWRKVKLYDKPLNKKDKGIKPEPAGTGYANDQDPETVYTEKDFNSPTFVYDWELDPRNPESPQNMNFELYDKIDTPVYDDETDAWKVVRKKVNLPKMPLFNDKGKLMVHKNGKPVFTDNVVKRVYYKPGEISIVDGKGNVSGRQKVPLYIDEYRKIPLLDENGKQINGYRSSINPDILRDKNNKIISGTNMDDTAGVWVPIPGTKAAELSAKIKQVNTQINNITKKYKEDAENYSSKDIAKIKDLNESVKPYKEQFEELFAKGDGFKRRDIGEDPDAPDYIEMSNEEDITADYRNTDNLPERDLKTFNIYDLKEENEKIKNREKEVSSILKNIIWGIEKLKEQPQSKDRENVKKQIETNKRALEKVLPKTPLSEKDKEEIFGKPEERLNPNYNLLLEKIKKTYESQRDKIAGDFDYIKVLQKYDPERYSKELAVMRLDELEKERENFLDSPVSRRNNSSEIDEEKIKNQLKDLDNRISTQQKIIDRYNNVILTKKKLKEEGRLKGINKKTKKQGGNKKKKKQGKTPRKSIIDPSFHTRMLNTKSVSEEDIVKELNDEIKRDSKMWKEMKNSQDTGWKEQSDRLYEKIKQTQTQRDQLMGKRHSEEEKKREREGGQKNKESFIFRNFKEVTSEILPKGLEEIL